MSKPSYMSQNVYELLLKAIEGLDKASNIIDDILYEMDAEPEEGDEVAFDSFFADGNGDEWYAEEIREKLEDMKEDIEDKSYDLWVLINRDEG